MYRNEFEKLLERGPLPRAVMLFGECPYFVDHYTELYLGKVGGQPSGMKLYYGEFDPALAKSHLSEPGLFGDGNLLIVKTDKKIDVKTLTPLLEAVDKNPASWLVLHYEADDAKAKSALFEKKGDTRAVVRFFNPNPVEAAGFLRQVATARGLELSDAGAHHLLKLHDYNLSLTVPELDKLLILGSADAASMDRMTAGHAEGDPLRLVKLLIEKKPFSHELEQILLEGEDEIRLLSELQRYFGQLFLFFACARLTGAPSSREVLGYQLPQNLERERAALAIRLNQHHYARIFELFSQLELQFKSSAVGDKQALLQSALIKLQTQIL